MNKNKKFISLLLGVAIVILCAVVFINNRNYTELQLLIKESNGSAELLQSAKDNTSVVVTENNVVYENLDALKAFIESVTKGENASIEIVEAWHYSEGDATYGGYTRVKEGEEDLKGIIQRNPDGYMFQMISSSYAMIEATNFDLEVDTEVYIERACRWEYENGELTVYTYIEGDEACKKTASYMCEIVDDSKPSYKDGEYYSDSILCLIKNSEGGIEDILIKVWSKY